MSHKHVYGESDSHTRYQEVEKCTLLLKAGSYINWYVYIVKKLLYGGFSGKKCQSQITNACYNQKGQMSKYINKNILKAGLIFNPYEEFVKAAKMIKMKKREISEEKINSKNTIKELEGDIDALNRIIESIDRNSKNGSHQTHREELRAYISV